MIRIPLSMLFTVVAVLGTCPDNRADEKDDVAKEKKLLEGKWLVTALVKQGLESQDLKAGAMTITIQGDKMTARDKAKFVDESTFSIDPSKNPREITITVRQEDKKAFSMNGIYSVTGDELRICIARPDDDRPKEFTSKEGSGTTLMTFKRIKD
jgi:uncharacterized protein (TIGR03067 family)